MLCRPRRAVEDMMKPRWNGSSFRHQTFRHFLMMSVNCIRALYCASKACGIPNPERHSLADMGWREFMTSNALSARMTNSDSSLCSSPKQWAMAVPTRSLSSCAARYTQVGEITWPCHVTGVPTPPFSSNQALNSYAIFQGVGKSHFTQK